MAKVRVEGGVAGAGPPPGGAAPGEAAPRPGQGATPPWFARLSGRLAGRLADRPVPDAIDYAIAAGCFAACTVPVLAGAAPRIGSPLWVAGFGILAAAPLIVRRKWPLATLAAVTAVYVAATLAGVRFTPWVSNAGPNFAIAVCTVADRCRRRLSLPAAAIAALATWVVLPLGIHLHHDQDQDAVQLIAAIPAWVAGDTLRARRTYRRRLDLQTRRQAAEREGRVRAEERLRLSREVHDVVSHSLSMIAVRSGVARLLIDEQPGEARTALSAIETASRSALDEVRLILRRIREPAHGLETAMPTLCDLPALASRLRDSGLQVSYHSTGQPRAYATALELSGYRIAQEALTNVVKHARATHASVEVAHGQAELVITVADDGAGPPAAQAVPGLGIVGMRERAELLGGQLTAAARPEGGFAVVARLPVRDSR